MSGMSGTRVRMRQMGSTTTAPSTQPSTSICTTSNRTNLRAPIMKANTIRPTNGMATTCAICLSWAMAPSVGADLDSASPASLTAIKRPRHANQQGTKHESGTSTANTISPTAKVTDESSSTSAATPTITASHKSAWRKLNCAR